MQRFAVIMAGGGGSRFWPLSRQQMPKQLLNISGNDVLINETINRIKGLVPVENIYIVTNRNQKEVLEQLVISELPKDNILFEPVGRNTAPCITYASMVIKSRNADSVMCVLPSDHYIENVDKFREVMDKAFNIAAERERLLTIGIKPVFPSTGYGYIRFDESADKNVFALEADAFIEKPSIERALQYVEAGNYLWNSGMFVWKTSVILENIQRFLPRLLKSVEKFLEYSRNGDTKSAEAVYSDAQSISIDFGVLERSDNVLVIPAEFGWNDIGSWDALGYIFPTDRNGNIIKAKHIGIATRNSIIYGTQRLIATIGLEGMIIADTPDALLICPRDRAQDVKDLVNEIKKSDMEEYI